MPAAVPVPSDFSIPNNSAELLIRIKRRLCRAEHVETSLGE
jgi:hypothetical protein